MEREKSSDIYSEFKISRSEYIQIPEDFKNKIIKRQLIIGLSDFISDNIDTLPITLTTKQNIKTDDIIYNLNMTIIDRDELHRLREIEWMYNSLR